MSLFSSERDRALLLPLLWELPLSRCPLNKSCPYKRQKWSNLNPDQQEKLKQWYQDLHPQVVHDLQQQVHHRKAYPSIKEKRQELKVHLIINNALLDRIEGLQTELELFELDNSIQSHILFDFTSTSPHNLCYWRKTYHSNAYKEENERAFGLLLLPIETFYDMLFPTVHTKTIDYENMKSELLVHKKKLSESSSFHIDDCRLTLGFVDLRKSLIDVKKKVMVSLVKAKSNLLMIHRRRKDAR